MTNFSLPFNLVSSSIRSPTYAFFSSPNTINLKTFSNHGGLYRSRLREKSWNTNLGIFTVCLPFCWKNRCRFGNRGLKILLGIYAESIFFFCFVFFLTCFFFLTCTFIHWLLNFFDLPRYSSESRKGYCYNYGCLQWV